ncbi:MAG: beta-lactamase family protein [Acidimicrobiia bacterium]|nr:beta-lactamase family protein [Acidimicrobiia bacterium]
MHTPSFVHRAPVLVVLVTLVLLSLLGACRGSTGPADRPTTFDGIDASIDQRIARAGLEGAGLLVVVDGAELRNRTYGSHTPDTVVPIASASKWLTAATMMTLVDEGIVSLDDTVARWLPSFTGTGGRATIRQLLSHTSGLAQASCIWDDDTTLADCVESIARQRAVDEPGTRFTYGNTSYSVAGRIIEVATGQSFEEAFAARIAGPVGMRATRFTDGSRSPTPVPAASAVSTLNDYGRFVRMLASDGVIDGRRVLRTSSVRTMESDAVVGLDTAGDGAVRTTGIGTYGLGVWRDVTGVDDSSMISSGNGAYGFYPWVDRARNGYGVLSVFDQRGAERAVPDSQRQVHAVWAAIDEAAGGYRGPPVTVHGR